MRLEDYISKERLKIYTDVLNLKPEEAIGGYNWNKALSAAYSALNDHGLASKFDHSFASVRSAGMS